MDAFIFSLEIIGTVAFSVSGAMTGLKKRMDIFGVAILGLITAVGGGVLRDIILGITPPKTFWNPVYALVSILTAIFIFVPVVREWLMRNRNAYEMILFIMDALGLGIFTVIGIRTAYDISSSFNCFLLVFVGVITGIGGGVMRDILAGSTPYIFVKDIYACASIIGALICVELWKFIGSPLAMLVGTAITVLIRCLSAHFKWNLPRPKYIDKQLDKV
ncbi:MAG: trimeric intracellular cation channel family protein [Clostridiales bacterium]|nr:trimeric intracellular cation channel family protein [Clostridiales bacterium]